MTKHIIGIIIFSFIVGTSAIIAGMFLTVPPVDTVRVSPANDYIYKKKKKKKRCRRPKPPRRGQADVPANFKINQAVYNINSQQLTTSFLFDRENDTAGSVDIALYFFVSDKYSTRQLATEYISVRPDSADETGRSAQTFTNSFGWLNKLQSHENLYVMAEIVGDRNDYENYPPVFDPSEATAILINSGRR